MNLIFKSFNLYLLATIFLSMFLAQLVGAFLPSYYKSEFIDKQKNTDIKLQTSKIVGIKTKPQPKPKKNYKNTKSYLKLREFSINAIFLDGKYSEVIVRDKKGGVFLRIGDSYKGYKVKELFINKALFSKNGDDYYAFLSPDDEKSFKEEDNRRAEDKEKISLREETMGTVSQAMFEEVKFKDGKYFIPQDLLLSYKNINKIFASISVMAYDVDGKIKFKVRRVSSGSVFSKMGLNAGDFIVKIDGKPFKSIAEPLKYFNDLENLKSISLTIERFNQTKELKYEVY